VVPPYPLPSEDSNSLPFFIIRFLDEKLLFRQL